MDLVSAYQCLLEPVALEVFADQVMQMSLQVEIKTTPKTVDVGHLQKAADFVHAFILGEAMALATCGECLA